MLEAFLKINRSKSSSHLKNIKNLYLQLPKQHKILISFLGIILMLALLVPSEKAKASRQNGENSFEIGKRYQVNIDGTALKVPQNNIAVDNKQLETAKESSLQPTIQTNETVAVTAQNELHKKETRSDLTWKDAKVRSGDSLAKIFKRLGYSAKTTHLVATAKGKETKLLKKLNVGDVLTIGKDKQGQLVALTYPLSKTKTLFVDLKENGYESHTEEKDVEIRETFAHGMIKSSFWNAAIEAGMDDGQIISLANIFGWDIDFALDIRAGDSFHVVYENRYVDGEYIGTGKILAAEFVNQNESFQAIRFTDGEYYTPDGKSMRKAFLRAPVNFRYISSNFKPKRFHPIQKRWKAHNGTDYRAKKGTPVVAAGNGKVTHSTYNKYNGNYVFIQHGDGIVTKYLHFSKRAVKKGARVKQGQVIGYVGSTGMSQAPHLHYEFLLNGVHRNPRTVKLPDAKPIAKKYLNAFTKLSATRVKELNGSKNALLAMQSDYE